jgi:thermostable 8-oxoguanine DNA glycosylase
MSIEDYAKSLLTEITGPLENEQAKNMTTEDLEMQAALYLEVGGMGHMVASHFHRNPGEDGAEADAIWDSVAAQIGAQGMRPFEEAIEKHRFANN